MKIRLIVRILGVGMLILMVVLLPMRVSAADSVEKVYALAQEDCKKISERLGEKITGGSQTIDDDLGVFGSGCEFANDYRKGYWGGYASKLLDDIRIAIVEINFRRYDTPREAQDDVRSMMESDSKNKANRTDILFTVRETPDGYEGVLKDPIDVVVRGFQTTYSGTVKIARGSCLISVTGRSFVENDNGEYRYHEYDTKKEKLINKHPEFNHDRETEMLDLAQKKAEEVFSVLDCGNDISSPSSTTPSVKKSLNKSKYTQALVIEPPKESDFKKVKPSDFEIIYPQNIPSSKPATRSASITGSIFIGKVDGDGELILQLPDGREIGLKDNKTAVETVRPNTFKWRGGNMPLLKYTAPKRHVSIQEIDCHILLEQERRDQEIIKRFGGITFASDWSLDDRVDIKPIGDCSYLNDGGPIRVLVEQGQVTFKTSGNTMVTANKADFGIGYDAKSGASGVEVYNGSVTVANKSGQSKTISTVYGSQINQVEIDKDGVMTEKTAIPLSEWEAFLASQQKKNNSPVIPVILVLGIGGLIFFLYRTGRLVPLYKTLSQKVSGLTRVRK